MFHLVITHTFVAIGSPMLSSSSWMHASRAALADIVLSLGAAEKQNSLLATKNKKKQRCGGAVVPS